MPGNLRRKEASEKVVEIDLFDIFRRDRRKPTKSTPLGPVGEVRPGRSGILRADVLAAHPRGVDAHERVADGEILPQAER